VNVGVQVLGQLDGRPTLRRARRQWHDLWRRHAGGGHRRVGAPGETSQANIPVRIYRRTHTQPSHQDAPRHRVVVVENLLVPGREHGRHLLPHAPVHVHYVRNHERARR